MQKTSSFSWFESKKDNQTEQPPREVAPFFLERVSIGLAVFLLGASVQSAEGTSTPSPVASLGAESSSSVAKGDAGPVSQAVPSPAPLSDGQKKHLRVEFNQALQTELKALNHQMNSEWKALKDSQRSREREWKVREKSSRRDFFKTTTSGAEKTKWMEDRKSRYQAFKKDLLEELRRVKAEQSGRRATLLEDQKGRAKLFEEALQQGLSPPVGLWHPTRSGPVGPETSP
jgi:hypothetical protein